MNRRGDQDNIADRGGDNDSSVASSSGRSSASSGDASTRLMDNLEYQESLYGKPMNDTPEKDVVESIKRAIKKIFRDVKFPSNSGTSFEKPNFVHPYYIDKDGNQHDIQAVTICEIILKRLSKYNR